MIFLLFAGIHKKVRFQKNSVIHAFHIRKSMMAANKVAYALQRLFLHASVFVEFPYKRRAVLFLEISGCAAIF